MTNEQAVDEVMAQVAALSPENAAIIKDPEAWLNAKFDALRERAEKAEAEVERLRCAIQFEIDAYPPLGSVSGWNDIEEDGDLFQEARSTVGRLTDVLAAG